MSFIQSAKDSNTQTNSSSNQPQKTYRFQILKQIKNLVKQVDQRVKKNQNLLSLIHQKQPKFQFQLLKPSFSLDKNWDHLPLAKHIMIKQIQNLLEQQSALKMKLSKISIRQEGQRNSRENQLYQSMNMYQFLRNAWKNNDLLDHNLTNQERIQRLNKTVGNIKGHILHAVKFQNQVSQRYASSFEQSVIQTKLFQNMSKNFETLKMQYEELISRVSQDKTIETAEQCLNCQLLQHQNTNLQKENNQLKHKIEKIEKSLLTEQKKNKMLEDESNLRKQQIEKMKKNLQLTLIGEDYKLALYAKQLPVSLSNKEDKITKTIQQLLQYLQVQKGLESTQKNTQPNKYAINPQKLFEIQPRKKSISRMLSHSNLLSAPRHIKGFKNSQEQLQEEHGKKARFKRNRFNQDEEGHNNDKQVNQQN